MARPLMHVTSAAVTRILELMKVREKPAVGIRIYLKRKGCSGLSYSLEYVDTPNPADEKLEVGGIVIYIDPSALLHLVGTEMDYEEEAPPRTKSGFLFRNPNEKGRCGCGESFHV